MQFRISRHYGVAKVRLAVLRGLAVLGVWRCCQIDGCPAQSIKARTAATTSTRQAKTRYRSRFTSAIQGVASGTGLCGSLEWRL
jgi:hypothetical protein